MAKLTRKRLYSLQLFTTLTGIVVSVYLLIQHTRVKNGIQGAASFCSFGKYADCDVVNTSSFSEVFGFPLATLGALFYTVLFALSIACPPKHQSFARFQKYFAILGLLGLATDIGLLGIQIFALHNFCLLCFITYLATVGALFTVSRLAEGLSGNWLSRIRMLIFQRRRGPIPPLANCLVSGAVFISITAAVFLLPAQIQLTSGSHQRVENSLDKFFENWKDMKTRSIDVKPGDGTQGHSTARVRIVAFSDFECPHCQQAAFALAMAIRPYQDRVFFAFKHFPLDSSCNKLVTFRMHENSCQLAKVSFCANQQGKFWDYHDRVFHRAEKNDHASWDQFKMVMKGLLSDKDIAACLNNSAASRNVQSDIQLGDSLGIRGTPSVFINGKSVTVPITVETIQRLIEIELAL